MKKIISIVIPFFNSEMTLERCIKSISDQTYKEFEVILVDDGSVDESMGICKSWAEKDNRFKYFRREHSGVSKARNYGLSLIMGEWFCFVDSDDWLEPDYLQVLLQNALETGSSVSTCDYQRNFVYSVGDNIANKTEVIEGPQECIFGFIRPHKPIYGMVWNKLYLSSKYADISFDESLKINEDCRYSYEIMNRCDKLVSTGRKLYHWFWRKDSACHARFKEIDFSAANVALFLLEKIEPLGNPYAVDELRKNYCTGVIKVFWETSYDKSSEEVKEAISRIKEWKTSFRQLTLKTKMKYYISVFTPCLKRLFVKN